MAQIEEAHQREMAEAKKTAARALDGLDEVVHLDLLPAASVDGMKCRVRVLRDLGG